jgi:hypothetical protein
MRILLVSRIDSRDARAFTEKVRAVLEQEGSDVVYDRDTAAALGKTACSCAEASTGGRSVFLRISNPPVHWNLSKTCLRVFPSKNG